MAREHARILCSIWSPGDDFRQRSPEAQRLYFLVLSQRELNNAGVIPLMIGKWARCSTGTTAEDVRKALDELVEHRYVVVDEDTEELLVRTFLRGDGVAKQPNVLTNALRLAEHVESPRLREALARELVRLGQSRCVEVAHRIFPGLAHDPAPVGSPPPTPKASPNGSPKPSSEPLANPSGTLDVDLQSTPAGWGGGRGRGRGPVPEVVGVGGRASAREAAPPPPAPPPVIDPTNPRCRRHRDVPADDPGPDCRVCRQVRLRVEADLREAQAAAPSERASVVSAIEACSVCDEHGYRPEGDYGAVRCTHPALAAAGADR